MDGNLAMANHILYESEEVNEFMMAVIDYMEEHDCDEETAIKAIESL